VCRLSELVAVPSRRDKEHTVCPLCWYANLNIQEFSFVYFIVFIFRILGNTRDISNHAVNGMWRLETCLFLCKEPFCQDHSNWHSDCVVCKIYLAMYLLVWVYMNVCLYVRVLNKGDHMFCFHIMNLKSDFLLPLVVAGIAQSVKWWAMRVADVFWIIFTHCPDPVSAALCVLDHLYTLSRSYVCSPSYSVITGDLSQVWSGQSMNLTIHFHQDVETL
jgi:hypothetical protein